MDVYEPKIGRVCVATSGRDAGEYFIIFNIIDNEYVEIVNGKTRYLASPKKKKLKHLKLKSEIIEKIADKIVNKKLLHDPEINSSLRTFREE